MSGLLQDTKAYLADLDKKSYKPSSADSNNTSRTLRWELQSGISFILSIKSEPEMYCDALHVRIRISPASKQSSNSLPSSSYTDQCKGHGTATTGKCICNEGYAGLYCEKCDAGYTQQSFGMCVSRLAITTPQARDISEGTSWSTVIMGVVVCAMAFSTLYYFYTYKHSRSEPRRERQTNLSGFDRPDEEERVALQDREAAE
jgi:hypothetical protein